MHSLKNWLATPYQFWITPSIQKKVVKSFQDCLHIIHSACRGWSTIKTRASLFRNIKYPKAIRILNASFPVQLRTYTYHFKGIGYVVAIILFIWMITILNPDMKTHLLDHSQSKALPEPPEYAWNL